MEHSRRVFINGKAMLYKTKAPYEPSGKSIKGALELLDIDMLKCHECGYAFGALGTHVNKAHGMSARAYKIKHGLKMKTSLVCERIRVRMSEKMTLLNARGNGSPLLHASSEERAEYARKAARQSKGRKRPVECQNAKKECTAQILGKLKDMSVNLGHTPTYDEMKRRGVNPESLKYRFGSLTRAAKVANVKPVSQGRRQKYTDEQLLKILANFIAVNHRRPTNSDGKREMTPMPSTFYKRFGSMEKAVELTKEIQVVQ